MRGIISPILGKKRTVMSENKKCYYCGCSFTPGSTFHGTYFGVQESEFGVVHPVCSKKCENEFKNHKVNKNREEDVQQSSSGCFGSVIFITIIILTGICSF